MTNIIETPYVYQWLASVLDGMASGGTWEGLAPLSATPPFIVYNLQSGTDENGVAGTRLWNDGLYQVKVIGYSSDYLNLATIAGQIDTALQKARDTTASIIIVHCVRLNTVAYRENATSGQEWSHIGGIYRIAAQPSA